MATTAAVSLRQLTTVSQCVASTSAAATCSSTRVQVRGSSLRFCAPRVSASQKFSLSSRAVRRSSTRTVVRCSADASGVTAEIDPALLDKVIDVIADKSGVEKDQIKADSAFTDLKIDSLDQVEIMMSLEDEYQISLDESNAQKLTSVIDVAKYISDEVKKAKK